jgi:integrase
MSEELIKLIQEKRPSISKTSLKTYESILRNLYYKVYPDDEDITIKKFDNSDKIISFLKQLPSNKRKTVLASLVVITDNKDYRELMLDDIKEYNKEQAKQTKTKEQEENWIEQEDLNKVFEELAKNAKLLYQKDKLTPSDYQEIQSFIILCLLSGRFIPPRRSKDYVNFKIKNIDKSIDNYIDKNDLVFNSYKTVKTYGQQRIELPKALKTILNKWIKINPTDYLLFDTSFNPLSNVKLTQRLNKLFGKKVSVNGLRKSYLSENFQPLIKLNKDLADTMGQMGSSKAQETIYIKQNK